MLGSPRQLENAVPTSKNPHGVWVWNSFLETFKNRIKFKSSFSVEEASDKRENLKVQAVAIDSIKQWYLSASTLN